MFRLHRSVILAIVPLSVLATEAQESDTQVGVSAPIENPSAEKFLLPKGTPIRLMVSEGVSSKNAKVGDPVKLQVVGDVKVSGAVVITRNAPATGTVLESHHAGRGWRAGNLRVQLESVVLVDGQKLPLHFPSTAKGGPTSAVADWAQFITQSGGFGIFFLPVAPLQHGNEAQFPRGSVFNVVSADETLLSREAVMAAQPQAAGKANRSLDHVTVYYYPNPGGTWFAELWCGRQKLSKLSSGTNVSFDLPPGNYWFRLAYSRGNVELRAVDGEDHYLQISGNAHLGLLDPPTLVDNDLGEILAADTKPVKPEDTPDFAKLDLAKLQVDPRKKHK
jgi:hypothetical protein